MALVAIGSRALARDVARVLVLGPSPDDPTVVRIRQELQILALDVEVAPAPSSPDLAAAARDHGATAVIVVEPSPPAIVVWIDPARHPDPAGPEVRIDEDAATAADPRIAALRAVELLRERLLPAPPPPPPAPPADAGPPPEASAPPPPPPPPPPRRDQRPPAPRETHDPSMFLGAAVLAGPGGVGATPHVWLGARFTPTRPIDLELTAFLPTTAATVASADGSMSVRAGGLSAGVGVRLTDPASRPFALAGLGIGAMIAGFTGQAQAPWKGASGMRPSMIPDVHAAAGYWVASHLAIRADVRAAFALPEPVLLIAGSRVASFGEPAVLVAAGLEVRP
jgi:hypothetical protein